MAFFLLFLPQPDSLHKNCAASGDDEELSGCFGIRSTMLYHQVAVVSVAATDVHVYAVEAELDIKYIDLSLQGPFVGIFGAPFLRHISQSLLQVSFKP